MNTNMGLITNHDPKRKRKLLLNKKEIKKIISKTKDKGMTVIPTKLFLNDKGWAKLNIAVARGKKLHDKRNTLKERDLKRDMERSKDIMDSSLHHTLKLNGALYTGAELLEFISTKGVKSEDWEYGLYGFISEWVSNSKTIEVHTSGSTGRPKKIVIPKRTFIDSALSTGSALNLCKGDSALLCLPCDYIAGKMMVVRSFVLGLNLITKTPNTEPLKYIKNVDFCAMTPMQAQRSINDLHKVKKLIIGGAEIDTTLEKELISKSTHNIYHTYGMTETASHVALRKLGNDRFVALPGVRLSQDDRKCLVIEAPLLFQKK